MSSSKFLFSGEGWAQIVSEKKKKEKIYVCFLQYLAANGKSLVIRVSQKNTFFEFLFGGRITGANRCLEATKNFSVIDP